MINLKTKRRIRNLENLMGGTKVSKDDAPILTPDATVDQYDAGIVGTLSWNKAQIGTDRKVIKILPGTYKLLTSLILPENIYLDIDNGALFKPAANVSLTVYSPENIIAGDRQQIIDATNNSTNPLLFTSGGRVSIGWYGGLGDNSTDETTAWNTSVAAVNGSGGEYYLPPGTYRLVPGSTTRLEVSLHGPEATIAAYDNTDDVLVNIDGNSLVVEDMLYFDLKALIGYDVANASVNDDTTVVSGVGLKVVSSNHCNYRIQKILGFDIGVYLDGTALGADGVPVSSSVWRFGHFRHNNYGLYLETKATWNVEDNEIYANYFYDNRTAAVRIIGAGGKVKANVFHIGALECHQPANAHGIHLSGTIIHQNTFIVQSVIPPTGTGKIIVISDTAVNNTFKMPTMDWTKINSGTNGNIFDMHTSYNSDENDVGNTPPGRSMIRGATAPAGGYWRDGDICWNDSPSDGTIGWICVLAGTPGTWVRFGSWAQSYTTTDAANDAANDDFDVTGGGAFYVDTSGGSVTIGGLKGGVAGQKLTILKYLAANDLVIENAEGIGTQDIYTNDGANITLSTLGGVNLLCNGANWYVISE